MTEDALDTLRVAFVELLTTDRRVRGREGRRADELSLAHYRMLSCLLDADRLPAGRLAAAADLTPASTTQALDVLEKRGMVQRERDPHDRRVVVASLTEEGRRLTAERRIAFRGLWEEILGDLEAQELATGTKILGRIGLFMEELTARKSLFSQQGRDPSKTGSQAADSAPVHSGTTTPSMSAGAAG